MEDNQKRHVKLAEASEISGIPVRTLQRWCKQDRVPSYRLGPKLWFIDLASLGLRI